MRFCIRWVWVQWQYQGVSIWSDQPFLLHRQSQYPHGWKTLHILSPGLEHPLFWELWAAFSKHHLAFGSLLTLNLFLHMAQQTILPLFLPLLFLLFLLPLLSIFQKVAMTSSKLTLLYFIFHPPTHVPLLALKFLSLNFLIIPFSLFSLAPLRGATLLNRSLLICRYQVN